MKEWTVMNLSHGYSIVQRDSTLDDGYVSFWLVDETGEDVQTFASSRRALDYWKKNKRTLVAAFKSLDEMNDKETKAWIKKMWES